jgi:hypothetical protein
MKTIYPKLIRNLVATSLAFALFVTSSMVALATPGQPLMGELTVAGESVSINGEQGFTGRTVSSNATLTTPADTRAIVNFGKAGRIEVAPNTTVTLNFDEKNISANLANGNAKIFGAADINAQIVTKDGAISGEANQANVFAVDLNSGAMKTVSETGALYLNNNGAVTKLAQDTDSTDDDGANTALYIGIGIIAAAVVGTLIYIATKDDDDLQIASPVR